LGFEQYGGFLVWKIYCIFRRFFTIEKNLYPISYCSYDTKFYKDFSLSTFLALNFALKSNLAAKNIFLVTKKTSIDPTKLQGSQESTKILQFLRFTCILVLGLRVCCDAKNMVVM